MAATCQLSSNHVHVCRGARPHSHIDKRRRLHNGVAYADDVATVDDHKNLYHTCMIFTCAYLLQWGAAYRLAGTPEEQQETLKVRV
jgi:hypothetical protein